jgi:hypothetical protein
VSAVDHLDAVRALVQDAGILHARAPFTLLRAALENSATAVWLLAPANRNERVLRRLRLQWADALNGEVAHQVLGAALRLSHDGWKGKLQAEACARGLPDEQVQAVTGRPVSYSGIVKAAGDEAQGCDLTGQDASFCWMLSSGIDGAQVNLPRLAH